jgi:replicative DNA helicase
MIQGRLSEAEMRLVIEESRRQVGLPIHYAEREARDMRKLRSAIRRARQVMSDTETPLGLIVIDYIQQLTHPDGIRRSARSSTRDEITNSGGRASISCASVSSSRVGSTPLRCAT